MTSQRLSALALAAALLALSALAFRPAPQAVTWEYTIMRSEGLRITATSKEQDKQMRLLEARINELADGGWELDHVSAPLAVFRRPRQR